MHLKRRFKKYYNRSMPLLCVQYWHQGEYYGFPKITNGLVSFNPLFVYKKDKAVDVYYDLNDPKGDDELLISYFKNRPKKFRKLADEYEKECQELLRLSKQARPKDFSKVFNLHISSWPKSSLVIILGKFVEERGLRQIAQHAYKIRRKTEKVEYITWNNLINLANQSVPDFKDFTDVLTFEEIINKTPPSKKELLKRKNKYIYFEGEIYTDLDISQLEKLKNIKILQEDKNLLDSKLVLKGTIAMEGRAKGRVKVIFGGRQLSKVKKGDILVTPMTTPDYVMAMRKAAAFVTDEGGLTCHAAITAREIGKPCIIGTKVASQVLKNGDLVEVDANKGVVKIIKDEKTSDS